MSASQRSLAPISDILHAEPGMGFESIGIKDWYRFNGNDNFCLNLATLPNTAHEYFALANSIESGEVSYLSSMVAKPFAAVLRKVAAQYELKSSADINEETLSKVLFEVVDESKNMVCFFENKYFLIILKPKELPETAADFINLAAAIELGKSIIFPRQRANFVLSLRETARHLLLIESPTPTVGEKLAPTADEKLALAQDEFVVEYPTAEEEIEEKKVEPKLPQSKILFKSAQSSLLMTHYLARDERKMQLKSILDFCEAIYIQRKKETKKSVNKINTSLTEEEVGLLSEYSQYAKLYPHLSYESALAPDHRGLLSLHRAYCKAFEKIKKEDAEFYREVENFMDTVYKKIKEASCSPLIAHHVHAESKASTTTTLDPNIFTLKL